MSQASECTHSGAVMNLKVERHTELRKKIGCCAFHFLCTVSRFGERFCDGQYSLVSFLFAVLLMVTQCPAICKSVSTCPSALWSQSQCVHIGWHWNFSICGSYCHYLVRQLNCSRVSVASLNSFSPDATCYSILLTLHITYCILFLT